METTVEAYYALLYSRCSQMNDPHMQKAKRFILAKGGLANVKTMLTQVMLALTAQMPWPENVKIPIEFMLFPKWFPLNIFDLSGVARVHLVPIMIAADQKFSIKNKNTPDLSDLYVMHEKSEAQYSFIYLLFRFLSCTAKSFSYFSGSLHTSALQRAEKFILERIDPDGTLYNYASSTILMIFALLSLGYSKNSPIISNAIAGLKSFVCRADQQYHLQLSTPIVWDTALISYALQQSGVPPTDPTIEKAGEYLLSRQQTEYGDWSVHNSQTKPGAWGFSDVNTRNPDVDCTVAALRTIKKLAVRRMDFRHSWNLGLNWLLSMQNADGGWAAFEKDANKRMLRSLPFGTAEAIDPSTPDLTGRVLQFLGNDAGLTMQNPRISMERVRRL